MTLWSKPLIGTSLPSFDSLVERYTQLLVPKKGRHWQKAYAEIMRQRSERLDQSKRLELEAHALGMVAANLKREYSLK